MMACDYFKNPNNHPKFSQATVSVVSSHIKIHIKQAVASILSAEYFCILSWENFWMPNEQANNNDPYDRLIQPLPASRDLIRLKVHE